MTGFRRCELPAIGGALVLIALYVTSTPIGLSASLIVSILIRHAGSWWRRQPAPEAAAAGCNVSIAAVTNATRDQRRRNKIKRRKNKD